MGIFILYFPPNEILFPNRSKFHFELGSRMDAFRSRQIQYPNPSLLGILGTDLCLCSLRQAVEGCICLSELPSFFLL